MSDATPEAAAAADAKGNDAVWPFFALYAVMWAGMIGTSLNTDAIKADYTPAVILGFALVLAIASSLPPRRFRRQVLFGFGHSTHVGNLAWHVFIVTGIVFICYLFFLSVLQIVVFPSARRSSRRAATRSVSATPRSSSGRRWRRARSSS